MGKPIIPTLLTASSYLLVLLIYGISALLLIVLFIGVIYFGWRAAEELDRLGALNLVMWAAALAVCVYWYGKVLKFMSELWSAFNTRKDDQQ